MNTRQQILKFRQEYAERYGTQNPSMPSDLGQILGLQEARLLAVALLLEVEPEVLTQFLDRLVWESDLSGHHLWAARNESGLPNPVLSLLNAPGLHRSPGWPMLRDLLGAASVEAQRDDQKLMEEINAEVRAVRRQRRDRSPEEQAAFRAVAARMLEQFTRWSPEEWEEVRKALEAKWTADPENVMHLSPVAWDQFIQALEGPPRDMPRMRALLNQPDAPDQPASEDLKEGIREPMRHKHGSVDRFVGRRPMKGDLVLAVSRLFEVPVEVLLPALDLVERTPGPPEVLGEIRTYLGLSVSAGKGWGHPTKFFPFQDVVEKTAIARIIHRAVKVLGTPAKAIRWLDDPIRALEWRTPREVAATDIERVLAVLTRIAHGVHE